MTYFKARISLKPSNFIHHYSETFKSFVRCLEFVILKRFSIQTENAFSNVLTKALHL